MVEEVRFSNFEFLQVALTEVEVDIALRLLAGETRRGIALAKGVSRRTIESQIDKLRRKLQAVNGPHYLVYLFVYLLHHKKIETVPQSILFPGLH